MNVSCVLHRLGVPCVSLVIAGGAIGTELIARMRDEGLEVVDVRTDSDTRESIAITESATARQYRISVPGPTDSDIDGLRRQILVALGTTRIVVLSGSIPPGVPDGFLGTAIEALPAGTIDRRHVRVRARMGRSALRCERELADLVGWDPATPEEIEDAVREVIDLGRIRAVVASRGPSGASSPPATARCAGFDRPPFVR